MASSISVEDFLNLTLPQVQVLLSQSKKNKTTSISDSELQESVFKFRRIKCGPDSPQWEAVQQKYPTDEDKRKFYGVWPFS